ncbi:MAG: 2-amino-4-hydroxy-6-hydroxymethyldihydropteridine diphosphokinase [Prevotella sp.]|nr:2-amino-4-hydroxy-6-hydroxymethyldihydropteridine diphosphokinase [Prevotella sp.]
MHKVYLGIGSNQGDRLAQITRAIELIGERVGTVVRQSSLIETKPWGFTSGNQFLNGAILVESDLKPREILEITKQIERELGRVYKGMAYRDRTIDIDILLYDDYNIDTPDLQIPHPLMFQREFVMIPLREINPEIKNPAD